MHQTMVILLKTLLLSQPPQTSQDVLYLVDDGQATTLHSMQSTISTVLKASLGALAFSCNMLLDIPLIVDWQTNPYNREGQVNNVLLEDNQSESHQL